MDYFKNMYDYISNPMDDESLIRNLIATFAEGKDIYDYLTRAHINDKKYKNGKHYIAVKDAFYAKLFKIWKDNVLSLTDNQIEWLIQHSSIKRDYYQLKQYLKTLPDIKTYNEFLALISDNELIEKYGWQALGTYSGWRHVSSRYLKARKEAGFKVEHRLYLNTESIHTEIITSAFVDKCIERNIPFYFKYDEFGNRDDTIVIYSNTENLPQYISILREIKKENTEIFEQIHQPPILTGKIDGWIGYGSEPAKLPNGKNTSFNKIREEAIEKAITKCRNKWIFDHKKKLFNYKNKKITLQEYLSIKITDNVIKRYKKMIEWYIKNGNEKQFYDAYGLVGNDFTNENLSIHVKHCIDKKMEQYIDSLMNDPKNSPTIKIPTRNGNDISVYSSDISSAINYLISQVLEFDHNFLINVKQAIKEEAKAYGIDTDKYCFDIAARDKLLTYQKPVKTDQNNNSILQKSYTINESNICDKLDPSLMKRRLKYPNGTETSAIQYIQEYFYPFIPEDGFFTLKNGNRISYKQFIEEFVMFEGQSRYNGDVARLLEATTKRNQDLITISNGTESVSFDPVEITNYLNPYLMKMKMRYPNGAETPAVQYIQEYFSPYIPENGMITLKNGNDISVKQFIEEFVIFEGQTKYNGDVARLMEATTRNNHGSISFDLEKESKKQIELKRMLSDSQNRTITNSGMKI